MVQFYPRFNFYFPLDFCIVMYDNDIEQKQMKIEPKIKLNHSINLDKRRRT